MESTLEKPALVAAKTIPRARTIVYWIVTALFCLQMSFTAYAQLRLPQVAQMASQTAQDRSDVAVPQGRKAGAPRRGNPQIAKADGDIPVQAYIAAMSGWKSDVGRRLDALIVRTVPACATRSDGTVLRSRGRGLVPQPPPASPGTTDVRYLDIHEDDRLDEARLAAWVRPASGLPGWRSP